MGQKHLYYNSNHKKIDFERNKIIKETNVKISNTDDLKSIINPYSQLFREIDIYKTNQFDYHDIDINSINTEFILIINSGMVISKKFIEKSFQYINDLNISMMFAPVALRRGIRTWKYNLKQMSGSFQAVCNI